MEMESVGSILSRLMAGGAMGELATHTPIWNDWASLVGDNLAAHMSPQSMSKGRLHVLVDNNVIRHRLELQKQLILSKINRQLHPDKVTDIVFDLTDRA